jgi:hypothetical protein
MGWSGLASLLDNGGVSNFSIRIVSGGGMVLGEIHETVENRKGLLPPTPTDCNDASEDPKVGVGNPRVFLYRILSVHNVPIELV